MVWVNLVEPCGVNGPGGVDKFEGEASSGVIVVQDRHLVHDLFIPGTRQISGQIGNEFAEGDRHSQRRTTYGMEP